MNPVKKKVLLLSFSCIASDPRPNRMMHYLVDNHFEVYTISLDEGPLLNNLIHMRIKNSFLRRLLRRVLLSLKLFINADWYSAFLAKNLYRHEKVSKKATRFEFDLAFIFDLKLLPLAQDSFLCKTIVFDAREYYPKQVEGNWLFDRVHGPIADYLCKVYLTKCDYILTVSNGLREEYKKRYGVESLVFLSVPWRIQCDLRIIENGKVKILFHGGANRNRKLENLITLAKMLDDRYYLDLVLLGDQKYENELKQFAKDCPRISFREPVDYKDIYKLTQEYDIGLAYFEPTTFNLLHCLPNKLFEYIQAGLMVISGPSPDIVEIVETNKLGICAKEFSIKQLADVINNLSLDQIEEYKRNSLLAANKLHFINEIRKLSFLLDA